MSATRFYFPAEGSGTPAISPAFDAGWEQTGQATRLKLLDKTQLSVISTLADNSTRTVPITTTQDILCNQFVSDPIPPQFINTDCKFSIVIRAFESATTANVTLAFVCKIVADDGTARFTLASSFNTDIEFPLSASAATRFFTQTAIASPGVKTKPGDRLVIEIGGHAAGPTAGTTYTMRQGNSAATDFALSSGLTTDLNPWMELSTDILGSPLNNYQFLKVQSAGIISVSEKIR